jgi:hypothetical protein
MVRSSVVLTMGVNSGIEVVLECRAFAPPEASCDRPTVPSPDTTGEGKLDLVFGVGECDYCDPAGPGAL